ncbi:hypothetical protein ACJRO7_030282 [Eucalyptus globulus]|uniref:Hexosyltransferase n=1 Tax=Eucalyptus globulus TaxID=34317 RepID=A0ABD3JLY7_EUCGL
MAPELVTAFGPTSMAPELVPASVKPAAKPAALSRAYVTFLAGSGEYVKGVVGLAKGLRKARSAYPLVVAVLPDVPAEHRRILEEQGCVVREIEPVYPPQNQTQFAMAYYIINYSKLRIWEFVEYSKMIYLDGDIQVFDNIDHLFDLEDGYFYAVMDCFCEKTWRHTPQYLVGYCQQCPDKVKWRDEMGPPPSLYFNTAMFVVEPNIGTYHDLLATLKTTPTSPLGPPYFLNMYFSNIYKPLPQEYNLDLTILQHHRENVELESVKVVQFCAAGSKPWKYTGQEDTDNVQRGDMKLMVKKLWDFALKEDVNMLVKKWWDIYEDESLDYKKASVAAAMAAAEGGAKPVNMEPFIAALSEVGEV